MSLSLVERLLSNVLEHGRSRCLNKHCQFLEIPNFNNRPKGNVISRILLSLASWHSKSMDATEDYYT